MIRLILFVMAATQLKVSTKVDSVMVMPSGGVVTRTGRVECNSGNVELIVPDLPSDMDNSTVRVQASRSLIVKDVFVTEGQTRKSLAEIQALTSRLDSVKDELNRLTDRLSVLEAQESLLVFSSTITKLGTASDMLKATIDTAKWKASLNFIGKNLGRLKAERRRIEKTVKTLSQLKDSLSRRLNELVSHAGISKAIHIIAYSRESGTHRITVSYRISSVSWKPEYEFRAKTDGDSITVIYFASIKQRTGEKWKNIKLTISTAMQPDWLSPPQFQPFYLSVSRVFREGVMATKAAAPAKGAMETAPQPAAVRHTELFSLFALKGRVSIPPGDWHRIRVATFELPAKFHRFAYPFSSPGVFIVAQSRNTSDYSLLPGQASLFLDGDFMRKITIPMTATGDSLKIAYGTDPWMTAERQLVKRMRSTTWDNKIRIEYHYRTVLRNLHKKPVTVTVVDRVPVSQDKRIKVKTVEIEPEPARIEPEIGKITWDIRVSQDGADTLKLGYIIEYPKGIIIPGIE